MKQDCGTPFDTIESAHDFVGLLAESVREAKQEIDAEVQKGAMSAADQRRIEALRMAAYSLDKLALHMVHSSRILNDLRTLRRLLNEPRAVAASKSKAAQAQQQSTVPPKAPEAIPIPQSPPPVTTFAADRPGAPAHARAVA